MSRFEYKHCQSLICLVGLNNIVVVVAVVINAVGSLPLQNVHS